MFVYELSGCGFESSCSHLNFRFHACFEQGIYWHSGKYGVWIHSETRTWHDKNIQSQGTVLIEMKYLKNETQVEKKRQTVFSQAFPSALQWELKLSNICVSWSLPKFDLEKTFSNLENRSFENVNFFLIGTI